MAQVRKGLLALSGLLLAPALVLDRFTVTPPAGAAAVRYTCPVGYG